jgi:hypothetical protein
MKESSYHYSKPYLLLLDSLLGLYTASRHHLFFELVKISKPLKRFRNSRN